MWRESSSARPHSVPYRSLSIWDQTSRNSNKIPKHDSRKVSWACASMDKVFSFVKTCIWLESTSSNTMMMMMTVNCFDKLAKWSLLWLNLDQKIKSWEREHWISAVLKCHQSDSWADSQLASSEQNTEHESCFQSLSLASNVDITSTSFLFGLNLRLLPNWHCIAPLLDLPWLSGDFQIFYDSHEVTPFRVLHRIQAKLVSFYMITSLFVFQVLAPSPVVLETVLITAACITDDHVSAGTDHFCSCLEELQLSFLPFYQPAYSNYPNKKI